MKASQIISRRFGSVVDFRPDADAKSPHSQLRRLMSLLQDRFSSGEDLEDEALRHYQEYLYRKIFTGTSHDEYLQLLETDPAHIEWAIAVHETEAEHFRNQRRQEGR
jgi:hypothetical protein